MALAHVLGNKGTHNKRCYVPMEEYHLPRYQDLQLYKQTRMGVPLHYLENNKESITSLQNKSSAAIKSNIHRSSKSITSSNDTDSSKISGFTFASNITTESSSRIFPNGTLVFVIDGNYKKLITFNKTRLNISIADPIISESLTFTFSQKTKIREGTGVFKERFQDIYSSQQKVQIQITT